MVALYRMRQKYEKENFGTQLNIKKPMTRISSEVVLKKPVPKQLIKSRTMSMITKRQALALKSYDQDSYQPSGIEKKGSGWRESTTIG